MATYLLVHGGWVGGWFWKQVAPLLRAAGHEVFTPTLTGLGERSHLAHAEIDLNLHAQDVAAVLEYEDLSQVILVGHSYGGMVITAASERVAERLAHLVYLDAFAPQDGQSLADFVGREAMAGFQQLAQSEGEGWRLPLPFPIEAFGISSEEEKQWVMARLAAQPIKTALQPVRLANPAAAALPRTFIYCTRQPMGLFDSAAQRAKAEGWRYYEIDAPHSAPATEPQQVANVLLEIASNSQ